MRRRSRRARLTVVVALLIVAASSGSPASSQTPTSASTPVAIRADEFRSASSVRITEVAGKTITGILNRAIERRIAASDSFALSTTASYSISGTIQELTIDDRRLNSAGSPLERLARIRVDYAVLDEGTGRDVVEKKNVIQELNYYTDTYSLEQGLTDREALEEGLLVDLARRIVDEIVAARSQLVSAAPRDTAPREQPVISDEERELLRGAERAAEARKYFSWIFNFADESINIPRGTLAAGGQNRPTTNRFTQTTTFKIVPYQRGTSEIKGVAIGKYESRDVLRQLSLQRGELEVRANPNHLYRFGTVSASLNKYVFDQTLAGIAYDGTIDRGVIKHNLTAIGGRDFRPNGIGDLSRYSYGGAWEVMYKDFAKVRFLADATQDQDPSTLSGTLSMVDNQIYGLSGNLKSSFGSVLTVDLARSRHQEVRNSVSPRIQGNLIDLKLTQTIKSLSLSGYYYYADQNFRTVYGSATSDREKSGLTATLPGRVRWLGYTWTGEFSRANRVANRTTVDVLAQSNLNLTARPYETSGNPLISEMIVSGDYTFRRSYEDVKIAGTLPANDRENNKISFNVKNTLWKAFTTSLTWDDERERDRLKLQLSTIQELKWENSYVRPLTDQLRLELKGNYRARDGGVVQDRYSTFGGALAYTGERFTGRFDYLRDLKRGTVMAQDSTKDRFTLDLSYTNTRGAFKNTITARGDYEINDFDQTASDYHRWTTYLELKVIF